MKYVIFRVEFPAKGSSDGHALELPVLFPELLVHDEVSKAIKALLIKQYPTATRVGAVAAGFGTSTSLADFGCHGESTSIGIASRGKQDSALMLMSDYGSAHVS